MDLGAVTRNDAGEEVVPREGLTPDIDRYMVSWICFYV